MGFYRKKKSNGIGIILISQDMLNNFILLAQQQANENPIIWSDPIVVNERISSSLNDLEENITGQMVNGADISSDLEIGNDGLNYQRIGLRFENLAVPKDALIENVYIQFTTDETSGIDSPELTIKGELSNNSPAFLYEANNLLNRSKTLNSVNWAAIPAWGTLQESGVNQRTPELKTIVQEIINQGGYIAGNAISLFIEDTGQNNFKRTAESFDGSNAEAPEIYVTYKIPVVASPVTTVFSKSVLVSASSDDSEENTVGGPTGTTNSSDLEIGSIGGGLYSQIGTRFLGLNIPYGAVITNAYVQFSAERTHSGVSPNLLVYGQLEINPPTFVRATGNINNRASTVNTVSWTGLPTWTLNERSSGTRTPDISAIIQELVNMSGYVAENPIVIITTPTDTGSGIRRAKSWDNSAADAPELVVEYTLGNAVYNEESASFISSVGTLTLNEQTASDQLITDFKTAGIWAKKDAIYPLLGNTAESQKWNLKDARDLDSAFRITWVGALTHGAGYIENTAGGLGNYVNTHLIPANLNTNLDTNDVGISFWKSAHIAGQNYTEMGAENTNTRPRIEMQTGWGANIDFDCYYYTSGERATFLPTDMIGLISGNRIGTSLNAYKNGVLGNNTTNTPFTNDHTIITTPIYFMGHSRVGQTGNVSAPGPGHRYRGFTIGAGLTDAETLSEFNAWRDFYDSIYYSDDSYLNGAGAKAFPASTNISNWLLWESGTTATLETADVRSGATALRLFGNKGTAEVYDNSTLAGVTPGQIITWRGWCKIITPNTIVNSAYGTEMAISLYDSDDSNNYTYFELDKGNAGWQRFEVSKMAVSGSSGVYFIFNINDGEMIVDDMELFIN